MSEMSERRTIDAFPHFIPKPPQKKILQRLTDTSLGNLSSRAKKKKYNGIVVLAMEACQLAACIQGKGNESPQLLV